MIDIRPFATLGHADHGWLNARHHFSFANYHDPARMGWGAIRVWNDDQIAAKSGFPPHPHRDMEIVTYVRTGAITHQDSMGNKGRTAAGDVAGPHEGGGEVDPGLHATGVEGSTGAEEGDPQLGGEAHQTLARHVNRHVGRTRLQCPEQRDEHEREENRLPPLAA